MPHQEPPKQIVDAVNGILADIRQRKEAIRMQNDKAHPKFPFSIGTVHGTAIVADHVTINAVNSPVTLGETEPISPEQVVQLDGIVSSIVASNPDLTKDGIWNDTYTALGTKAFIPLSRFDEAKAILAQRAASTVHIAVNASAADKPQ